MNNRYQTVTADLQDLGSSLTPNEAQGILIGLWVGGGRASEVQWLHELVDAPSSLAMPVHLRAVYTQLVEHITTADSFGIELLLPDDDQPFQMRLMALIEFTQSVLYGYSIAQGPAPQLLSPEVREVYDDLQAISVLDDQVDDEARDAEEDEINLQEIVDYLSAALIVMYIGLHPPVPESPATLRQH